MSLAHMKKRNVSFRKTLLGIVKDLHEKFCASIGVDISKKTIKRWHPQFKLEECHIIKPGKFLPKKFFFVLTKTFKMKIFFNNYW